MAVFQKAQKNINMETLIHVPWTCTGIVLIVNLFTYSTQGANPGIVHRVLILGLVTHLSISVSGKHSIMNYLSSIGYLISTDTGVCHSPVITQLEDDTSPVHL